MKPLVLLFTLLISTVAVAASEPHFVNAKLQRSTAAAGLEKSVRGLLSQSSAPKWIGYSVATQATSRFVCCFDSHERFTKMNGCCGMCRLEGGRGSSFNSTGGTCVGSEPPDDVLIMLRAEGGKITRVRPFTPDCALDAGNLPVHWLTDVRDSDSVAMLSSFIKGSSAFAELRSGQMALDAIALHRDPAADTALESFMTPQNSPKVREQAAFWIGQERGHHGFEVLQRYIRTDVDADFREHLTFAISQSRDPEAVQELIRTAHQDRSSDVRGQALFWMAQQAGNKIAAEINRAIDEDPETDVKKKAVFALSQMPEDEGIPKLIEVARSHRNPVVRKEAVFWLGQSKDPRALAFIEQVLLK